MEQTQAIISAQYAGLYRVYLHTTQTEWTARPGGALRRQLSLEGTALVTGDRVLLDRAEDTGGAARILALQPRTSLLTRVEVGMKGRSQPLAANINKVLICTSLNEEFNPNRLARYLALSDGAGLPAVLLLTKADLVADPAPYLDRLALMKPQRDYLLCSGKTGQGIDRVLALLESGQSAVLLGSSGVGKSSLVNALLGETRMHTREISGFQAKGRHTTTSRELIPLQNGAFLIDTPGMRELKLDSSDVESGFEDIQSLAAHCRFRDCRHQSEPGCAVSKALAEGALDRRHLANFQKLLMEQQGRERAKRRKG